MRGGMKSVFVAILVIAVASAGSAFAGDLQAKITVWAWPSADKAFDSVIAGFNAKYPGIQVSWEMKPGQAAGTRDALLAAMAAGAGGPDVALLEVNDIGMYALHGGFVDLRQPPYNAEKYKSDFVGYKWALATGPDGSLFAFPWDIGPAGVFYRRDLLDKAGVPSDPDRLAKVIKTWDDFYTVGKKVNDPANKVWWIDTAQGIPYIYYAHKNFFDKRMNVAIDNPTTRRVLTIAQKIRNAGMDAKAALWTNEWYTMLNEGHVATSIVGCWFGGFLKSWIAKDTGGKWGVIPVRAAPAELGRIVPRHPADKRESRGRLEVHRVCLRRRPGREHDHEDRGLLPRVQAGLERPDVRPAGSVLRRPENAPPVGEHRELPGTFLRDAAGCPGRGCLQRRARQVP